MKDKNKEFKKLKEQYGEIITITAKDAEGKELVTYLKVADIEERKDLFNSFASDNYFDKAEQFIKNNMIGGDNLFADSEALFSVCARQRELVSFDSAKRIATPEGVNAHFSIEGTNGMVAHFSKPDAEVKKKLFKLLMKGIDNPFTLGEIVLMETHVGGDDLSQNPDVFASASIIASYLVEMSEAIIKKN